MGWDGMGWDGMGYDSMGWESGTRSLRAHDPTHCDRWPSSSSSSSPSILLLLHTPNNPIDLCERGRERGGDIIAIRTTHLRQNRNNRRNPGLNSPVPSSRAVPDLLHASTQNRCRDRDHVFSATRTRRGCVPEAVRVAQFKQAPIPCYASRIYRAGCPDPLGRSDRYRRRRTRRRSEY